MQKPVRYSIFALLANLPLAFAAGADTIENRTGLRSEEVIRQEMKQAGIDVLSVTLNGNVALVRARSPGQGEGVISVDRIGDSRKVTSGNPAARKDLIKKLSQPPKRFIEPR